MSGTKGLKVFTATIPYSEDELAKYKTAARESSCSIWTMNAGDTYFDEDGDQQTVLENHIHIVVIGKDHNIDSFLQKRQEWH